MRSSKDCPSSIPSSKMCSRAMCSGKMCPIKTCLIHELVLELQMPKKEGWERNPCVYARAAMSVQQRPILSAPLSRQSSGQLGSGGAPKQRQPQQTVRSEWEVW